MGRRVQLAVVCWVVLIAGGCAPQPDVTATDDDNGGHVQLRTGQLFDIVLADDYDVTGCQWREERNTGPETVEFLGARYEPARKPPAGNGNGTNTERYRAQQTGTARISLVESDNAGKVCRRYALNVTVGPTSITDSLVTATKAGFPVVAALAVVMLTLGLVGRLVYLLFRRRRE
ncbi:hypothetical protein [Mycolicibacterium sp. XJ775]|jgi:predicted secreted protein